MPSPNPTVRRQHSGNAVSAALSAPIVNGTDTSFTITTATGWPDGAVGSFVVTINAGQSDAEKILCSTRSGTTVNVATRGYDGTTAAGHAAGATAAHTISAVEVDEANQHANATTGVHGATGAVVGTSDSQTLTNKTLTSPTINTGTGSLDAATTIGGVSGTTLAADRTAWTTYTPATFTNCTSPVGNFAYKQIGKTLHLRWEFTSGTVTASTPVAFTLPAGVTALVRHTVPTYDSSGVSVLPFPALDVPAAGGTLTTTYNAVAGGNLSVQVGRGSAIIEVA